MARNGVPTLQGFLQLCLTSGAGALHRVPVVSSTGFVVVCGVRQEIHPFLGLGLGPSFGETWHTPHGGGYP